MFRLNHVPRAAYALALGLAIAACGGGGATSTSGGSQTQPAATQTGPGGDLEGEAGLCGLFTADQAQAALGEAVGDAIPNRGTIGGLTYFCRYPGLTGAILDVEYSPGKTREVWDAEMTTTGMAEEMAVSGIGEAAFLADETGLGPGARISAYGAGGSIWITITKEGDAATLQAAAQQAAKDLIAALGG